MFIVIEKAGGWEFASIVTDEAGENKVFNTMEEALTEADECEDGIVVGDEVLSLPTSKLVKLLKELIPRLGFKESGYNAADLNKLNRLKREVDSCS